MRPREWLWKSVGLKTREGDNGAKGASWVGHQTGTDEPRHSELAGSCGKMRKQQNCKKVQKTYLETERKPNKGCLNEGARINFKFEPEKESPR